MADQPVVLILDSDVAAAGRIQGILSEHGVLAECVHSGPDALQRAGKHSFDAAIVDVHPSDPGGADLLEHLKACSPDMERIVMTAQAPLETALHALNQGAFAYVLKPPDPEDLVARVHPEGERPPELPERGVDLRPLESKTLLMTEKGVRVPVTSTVFELNDAGLKGDEIPGDGIYSASYRDTRVDGLYEFRFLLRAPQGRRKGVVTREGVRSVWVKPRLDTRTSKARFIGRRYDERLDRTRLRFRLTPTDRYGNRIGPGNEDRIRDLLPAPGSRVTDNHDGTYEVEVTRKGRVDPADVNRMGLFGRSGG